MNFKTPIEKTFFHDGWLVYPEEGSTFVYTKIGDVYVLGM